MFLTILHVDIKYYFFRVLEYIIENVEGLFALKIFKTKHVLNFFKDLYTDLITLSHMLRKDYNYLEVLQNS